MSPYTCPVCGKLLKSSSSQVIHMHEKSKYHLDAKLQGNDNDENKPNVKIETKPEVKPVQKVVKTIEPDQPKTQKLDIKPVEPKKNVENQKTEDEEWGGFFGD